MKEIKARPGQPYYRLIGSKIWKKLTCFYLNKVSGDEINLDSIPEKDNNFDLVIKIAEGGG
jgi:hypothetical protein